MCRRAVPALDAGRRDELTGTHRGPGGTRRTQEAVAPHMPILLHAPAACLAMQDAKPHGGLQTAVSKACHHLIQSAGTTGVISSTPEHVGGLEPSGHHAQLQQLAGKLLKWHMLS